MEIMRLFKRAKPDCCEAMWPLLSAYADSEAADSEARRVESHILKCESCASALTDIQRTAVSLRTTEMVNPPAYLRGAILAAAESLAAAPGRRRPAVRIQWGFGAAAAAGVLAALVFHANVRSMDTPIVPAPVNPDAAAKPSAEQPENQSRLVTKTPSTGTAHNDHEIATRIAEQHRNAAAPAVLSEKTPSPERALFPSVTASSTSKPIVRVAARRTALIAGPTAPMGAPNTVTVPMPPMETTAEPPMSKPDIPIMPIPMETPMAPAESNNAPAGEPAARTIVLTAESRSLPAGQVASLADLKKSLSQQKWQVMKPEAFRGANGRVISLDIVKRSF